jgi:hypothetical protein
MTNPPHQRGGRPAEEAQPLNACHSQLPIRADNCRPRLVASRLPPSPLARLPSNHRIHTHSQAGKCLNGALCPPFTSHGASIRGWGAAPVPLSSAVPGCCASGGPVWLPSLTNCVTARAIGAEWTPPPSDEAAVVAVVLGPLGGGGGGPAIISVSQWASVLSMTSMYEEKHLRVDTLCVCVCVRARARARGMSGPQRPLARISEHRCRAGKGKRAPPADDGGLSVILCSSNWPRPMPAPATWAARRAVQLVAVVE